MAMTEQRSPGRPEKTTLIDHAYLDFFEAHAGDPDRVPMPEKPLVDERWRVLEDILLDLHMVRHGYADERYTEYVDKCMSSVCEEESVKERVRGLRL